MALEGPVTRYRAFFLGVNKYGRQHANDSDHSGGLLGFVFWAYLMRNLALLLLLLTVLNPRLALAEDYYWIQSHNQQRYTSYTQACADFEDYIKKATPTATLNVFKVDSKSIACQMKTPQGAVAYVANVNRYGDGCTPPKVYEASTGKCDFPPDPPKDCSDKAGKPVAWSLLRDDPLQGMGVIEYMCVDGCRVAPAGSSTCGATPDGPTPGVCWGLGTYTGTECYQGDGANGGSPPKSPDPTDPTKPPLCPRGWSPTGSDGKGPCMPNPDPNDPDPNNPAPNNPDPNNPDPNNPNPGGGNNGGGNNGGNNGGGDGGDDGSGTGGDDGEGGNSGGDNDEDDDSPEASVAGESCDRILKCEGDPVQCAILRKNKEIACQWRYGAEEKGLVEKAVSGEGFALEEKNIQVGSLFTEALNKGRWLPNSCPAPKPITIMGKAYQFSWEPLCQFARTLAPIIVALASLFFAVHVGRGIKGD